MADSPHIWKNRETIWRIARLWLVVLALGIAVIGIFFALLQAKSFSSRVREQLEVQAARVAHDARNQFDQQLSDVLDRVTAQIAHKETTIGTEMSNLPGWVDGIFSWDGTSLVALAPPSETGTPLANLTDLIRQRMRTVPLDGSPPPHANGSEMLYGQIAGEPFSLTYRVMTRDDGPTITAVVRINTAAQKPEVIEPLLPAGLGLQVVQVDPYETAWTIPLTGALKYWAIRPTEALIAEQRDAVFRQTLTYLGLTVLSLATLLVAMWFLVRLARQEVALAKLKANFVADVSHELKTPLALIRMFGETLQAGRIASEEKRQEYYEIITREATRLTNLINNILDFASIEAGKRQYTLAPVDIGGVVRQTYHTYSSQLEGAGFEHFLSVAEDLPLVDADGDAISQAVLNLINNAQKYSDEERHIVIDVAADTRRGHRGVVISVHDRGIGISPDDRARLVEGFFRASDDRVRERAGTGLGLSLVRHIVQAHGGFLNVESRLVKGSTFRIFLPESASIAVDDSHTSAE